MSYAINELSKFRRQESKVGQSCNAWSEITAHSSLLKVPLFNINIHELLFFIDSSEN